SFNLSIFQSFNLSIFQSFNLSIFQSQSHALTCPRKPVVQFPAILNKHIPALGGELHFLSNKR
ncbi:MAG TPA: hypothetical protein VJ184_06175, partial [Chryseolinea sp.]|nr:hypothetical protein [Chryseolinea sp.]